MLEQERQFALQTVCAAVRISRQVQSELTLGRWNKQDRTPVTVADLAVQALVSGALLGQFPADPLMAEEESRELREPAWADLLQQVTNHVGLARPERPDASTVLDWIERGQQSIADGQRYWVLDPIDGTKGFLRREQYAIALALVQNGEVLLGVLACPNLPATMDEAATAAAGENSARTPLGQIYVAVKGQGAERVDLTADDQLGAVSPLRVSPETNPALTRWCERVESSQGNQDLTAQIAQRSGIVAPPYRVDSQAKYAVVARGEAVLYLRHSLDKTYRERVWDHAAGVLVIEEAGGRVTDLYGRPLDFAQGRSLEANRGIIATNGALHERVFESVQALLGDA